jgi:predicted GIY-YIG superfamily endonuclease
MLYIYILKLEGNKYYVGKTTNPDRRFKSHIESSGSSWTTKYPPIKQLKIIRNCDKYDEHKYTIKYMEKYGIDNVRGASYCRVKLTGEEKRDIKRQIDGAKDVCHKCGDPGHFIRNCPLNKPISTKTVNKPISHTKIQVKDSWLKEIFISNVLTTLGAVAICGVGLLLSDISNSMEYDSDEYD